MGVYVCMIHCKELGYVNKRADKAQSLQLASWGSRMLMVGSSPNAGRLKAQERPKFPCEPRGRPQREQVELPFTWPFCATQAFD